MTGERLSLRHAGLALVSTAIWGTNFVVIKLALAHFPPLTFAALRFAFAFFPAVCFFKRPQVPWRNLAAFGIMIGVGQFGLLYIALRGMVAPGLASLVMQSQAFFTIGLAVVLHRERVGAFQAVALILGLSGLCLIGAHMDCSTTPLGLTLLLGAALSWSTGNLIQRSTPEAPSLSFVVWASAFAVPPLLLLAFLLDGPQAMAAGIASADLGAWAALLWQSFGNTLFGYAVWGYLLARYSAATVSPWSLLIPVFGLLGASLVLGEPLPVWKLAAAGLILGGLTVNLLGPRLFRKAKRGANLAP